MQSEELIFLFHLEILSLLHVSEYIHFMCFLESLHSSNTSKCQVQGNFKSRLNELSNLMLKCSNQFQTRKCKTRH
jgi:hypothetical protein